MELVARMGLGLAAWKRLDAAAACPEEYSEELTMLKRAVAGAALLPGLVVLPLAAAAPASASHVYIDQVIVNLPSLPQTVDYRTVPIQVKWSGFACNFDVYQSTNGGEFSYVTTTASYSYVQRAYPGNTYRLQVIPDDCADNYWTPGYSRDTYVEVQPDTLATLYGPNWARAYSDSTLGGSHVVNSRKGSYAVYRDCYNNLAWVATKSPRGGVGKVYVDGVLASTVNLYSSTTKYRQMVFKTYSTSATYRSVKIVNASTSSTRNKISIDGFVRLDNGICHY